MKGFRKAFAQNLSKIIQIFKKTLINLSKNFQTPFNIFQKTPNTFKNLSRAFQNLPKTFQTISKTFQNVSKAFQKPFKNLSKTCLNPAQTFKLKHFKNISKQSFPNKNISKPFKNLSKPFKNLKQTSKSFFKNLETTFQNHPKTFEKPLKNCFSEPFPNLFKSVQTTFENLSKTFQKPFKSLLEAFKNRSKTLNQIVHRPLLLALAPLISHVLPPPKIRSHHSFLMVKAVWGRLTSDLLRRSVVPLITKVLK